MLVILSSAPRRGGQRMWECRCDCGSIVVMQNGNLRRSTTKSCGCGRMTAINPGDRFGMLVAIKLGPTASHRRWLCKCDCGQSTMVPASFLIRGNTKSCGCKRRLRDSLPDLTGRRVGKFTVVGPGDVSGQRRWRLRCDCGTERIYTTGGVGQLGDVSSCHSCASRRRRKVHVLFGEQVTVHDLAWIAHTTARAMQCRLLVETPEEAVRPRRRRLG